jgi:hypothetical protein
MSELSAATRSVTASTAPDSTELPSALGLGKRGRLRAESGAFCQQNALFAPKTAAKIPEKGAAELRFPSAKRAISRLYGGFSFRRDGAGWECSTKLPARAPLPAREGQAAAVSVSERLDMRARL